MKSGVKEDVKSEVETGTKNVQTDDNCDHRLSTRKRKIHLKT